MGSEETIVKMKKFTSELLGALINKENVPKAFEAFRELYETEFRSYKEKMGRVIGMMPRDYSGVQTDIGNVYENNFMDLTRYGNEAVSFGLNGEFGSGFQSQVEMFFSSLGVAEMQHDCINDAFRKKSTE